MMNPPAQNQAREPSRQALREGAVDNVEECLRMTERLPLRSVLAMVLSASLSLPGCAGPPAPAPRAAERRAGSSTDSAVSFVNRVSKYHPGGSVELTFIPAR
jgi:hypothetical protein